MIKVTGALAVSSLQGVREKGGPYCLPSYLEWLRLDECRIRLFLQVISVQDIAFGVAETRVQVVSVAVVLAEIQSESGNSVLPEKTLSSFGYDRQWCCR